MTPERVIIRKFSCDGSIEGVVFFKGTRLVLPISLVLCVREDVEQVAAEVLHQLELEFGKKYSPSLIQSLVEEEING